MRAQSLLRELRRYEPYDTVERQHCRDLITLLEAGENGFSRDSFEPGHVTASCFVVDAERRLLLHHHKRLGRWLQMGGHVEPDELLADAALREAREESGLRDLQLQPRILDVDVHPIPAAKGEPDHRHFDVRYLAVTRKPESIAIDRNESEDLRWFTLEEAVARMDEPAAVRAIAKIGMLLPEHD